MAEGELQATVEDDVQDVDTRKIAYISCVLCPVTPLLRPPPSVLPVVGLYG